MIAPNDWRQRERLDALSRLENLVLRETDPEAWDQTVLAEALDLRKRLQSTEWADTEERTRLFADMYRFAYITRTYGPPKEYFLWLLTVFLHIEAHVGPDAVLHRKEYLGPLWDRLDAIHERHGWPKEDDEGDPWCPEHHLDEIPEDYGGWVAEFDRVHEEMEGTSFRAVCQKYGVPEIADLKESDPEEYERRWKIGHDYSVGPGRPCS